MKNLFVKSDYRIALERYREVKAKRDKVINTLRTCYEAIAIGVIHGRKEQGMINRITQLNSTLYSVSVELAYAEHNLNIEAKKKENRYE